MNFVDSRTIGTLCKEQFTVGTNGIAVDLRKEGLGLVLRDMLLPAKEEAFA